MLLHILNTTFLDAPTFWQIGFQDSATPIINGIIYFHNHLIYYLLVIGTFVVFLLFRAWTLFKINKAKPSPKLSKFTHSTPLEVIWTITPALLLILIAGPSFALLYSIDEGLTPESSLKVIGHQWYWSYEYGDFFNKESGKTINFDSYIVGEDDLSFGGLRLLEVDNRVKLPINQHIRVLVSSADVLHSWAVPSLGIKIDACPGRLNQVSLYLLRKGTFYGQCSEICGVNHGFIPIVVEGVEQGDYLSWVKNTHLEGTLLSPLNRNQRSLMTPGFFSGRAYSSSTPLLVHSHKRGSTDVGLFPTSSGGGGGEDPHKNFKLDKGHYVQPTKKSRIENIISYSDHSDSEGGEADTVMSETPGGLRTPPRKPVVEHNTKGDIISSPSDEVNHFRIKGGTMPKHLSHIREDDVSALEYRFDRVSTRGPGAEVPITPVAPVNTAPVAPVDTAPVAPVDTAPVAPVDTAPVAPVDTAPVAPVDTAPVAPVDTAPVAPVDTAPVVPVDTAPVAPVIQAPVAPAPDNGEIVGEIVDEISDWLL